MSFSTKVQYKTDLKQRVYQYSLRLIQFIDKLGNDFSARVIGKQLLRSGTSIGANYIEAHGANGRKDFANFLNHSLKSANESKFWLELLKDSHKSPGPEVEYLAQETSELAKMLAASLITIRGK